MRMLNVKSINLASLLLSATLLIGCGGSDDPDTTPPVITLNGTSPMSTEVFAAFSDPGATAVDDRDGAVSVSVSGAVDVDLLGEYTLQYSARDAAGNTATLNRIVRVVDSTAPVITLNGEQRITLQVGQEYIEQGAIAVDNLDGNIAVTITSTVDTQTTGEYTVTYTATDSSGNSASVVRTVIVEAPTVTITIDQFGEGSLTVMEGPQLSCATDGSCVVRGEQGDTLVLAASPTNPWLFKSFRGCDEVDATAQECRLTLTNDTVISATFTPNADGITYQFADGVVELDDMMKARIVDFNSDTGVITFERGTDVSAWLPGTILLSTGTVDANGNLNTFFLKRVERILGNASSLQVVQTTDATLTDLFAEAVFVYQQPLTADDVVTESLPDGLTLRQPAQGQTQADTVSPIEFMATNLVIYDEDDNFETTNDQISLSGAFKVWLNPDLAFDVEFPAKVNEFRSVYYIDMDTSAAVTVGGDVSTGPRDLRAYSINLRPVAVGPVVIVPALEINLQFEASTTLAMQPTVTAKTKIIAGAHYRADHGWSNVADLENTITTNDWAETIDVKAQATLGPEILATTRLYGVAGPNVIANALVGVEAIPLVDSELCTVDVNSFFDTGAKFGANFRFLTKRFDYNVDLFRYKVLVEAFSRQCASGQPDMPTEFSVTPGPDNSLMLDWLAVGEGNEITYSIIRDGVGIVSGYLASEYQDRGLTVGEEYCYAVVAVDDVGTESDPTPTVCAIVEGPDTEAPSMPLSLIATPLSSSAIGLQWEASTDNVAVTGYTVYQQEDGELRAIDMVASNQTEILQLASNTEYCFAVSAYDAQANVSDQSVLACATTLPVEAAQWTMFIKCQGAAYYVVEESFDLNEEFTEDIFVFGNATDYNGTPMVYNMFGVYESVNQLFTGEINWSFEGSSSLRKDTFTADLSTSDTGDVAMNQVQVTGCDADIRFVKQDANPSVIPLLEGTMQNHPTFSKRSF